MLTTQTSAIGSEYLLPRFTQATNEYPGSDPTHALHAPPLVVAIGADDGRPEQGNKRGAGMSFSHPYLNKASHI